MNLFTNINIFLENKKIFETKKSNSPEKWEGFKNQYKNWWDNLSIDDKNNFKKKYETIRENNSKKKFPYPDMYDTTNLRLSQLSDKHIYRIWCFKDNK